MDENLQTLSSLVTRGWPVGWPVCHSSYNAISLSEKNCQCSMTWYSKGRDGSTECPTTEHYRQTACQPHRHPRLCKACTGSLLLAWNEQWYHRVHIQMQHLQLSTGQNSRQSPWFATHYQHDPGKALQLTYLKFVHGQNYLVTTNRYSNFFEIDHLNRKTSLAVVNKLKPHMARYGLPEK